MIFRTIVLSTILSLLISMNSYSQTPMSLGEHNAILNGVRLWYKVAGQPRAGQPPLLFLHGGPGYNSYSFEKTIGVQLERHTQMIYLDERGSGRSERPQNKRYEMLVLVEDVEALRQSLGVNQLVVMGHSFGGTIALEYAARYPDHVQKLIILDGAADIPRTLDLWQAQIQRKYPAVWQNAEFGEKGKLLQKALAQKDDCTTAKARFALLTEALGHVNSSDFRHWQQFHDQRYRKEQDALDDASGLRNTGEIGSVYFGLGSDFFCYHFTAYHKLTMPVLVIVGKYDGAIGAEQMLFLAKHLPHAQFDEFEQSAHFPYAEEPVKFEQDVAAFLISR